MPSLREHLCKKRFEFESEVQEQLMLKGLFYFEHYCGHFI